MQKDILAVGNGLAEVYQLPLFQLNEPFIHYVIPLNYIGRPDQYQEIRQAIKELATIGVEMLDEKKKQSFVTGLFSAVVLPFAGTRTNKITIQVRDSVAKMLIHLETKRNQHGKLIPMEYTSYNLMIAATCKNKYTSRIYKLLCKWREIGKWVVDLEEIRELLQLEKNNYVNFNDFKKRILMPVQKELKEAGDIWFNCNETGFEKRTGKKVTGLHFRIIFPIGEDVMKNKITHMHQFLKMQFKVTKQQWDKIQTILNADTNWKGLFDKIEEIDRRYVDKPVEERQKLLIKILLNDFKPDNAAEQQLF